MNVYASGLFKCKHPCRSSLGITVRSHEKKIFSLLSNQLNMEKITHKNTHSTYSFMTTQNPLNHFLSLFLSSQWTLTEYSGISKTGLSSVCKPWGSNSPSSMEVKTPLQKSEKRDRGTVAFL